MFKVEPFLHKGVQMGLRWWYGERDNIDMEPYYQRLGGIWNPEDKAWLIDSVINEYDIPKLYVADFTYVNTPLNIQKKPYAIVDGKQRFEAIFEYFENKLKLSQKCVYIKDPNKKIANMKYLELIKTYPEIAEIFVNYKLTIMRVITDEENKIDDLFIRLNRVSKSLTGAEVRNAMPGLLPRIIRDLAEHVFFKKRIRFSTKRMADRNAIAKIMRIEYLGKCAYTRKNDLDRLTREVHENREVENKIGDVATRVRNNLDVMAEIFRDDDPLLSSQGPISLYYWFIRENIGFKNMKAVLRPFLEHFVGLRKSNRERAEKGLGDVDENLLNFDLMDRDTNSQRSLEGRYRILTKYFKEYIRDH